jgi:hypothetical protein
MLSAQQEMDLMVVPEAQHARIVAVLQEAPRMFGAWDGPVVTSVAQAREHIQRQDAIETTVIEPEPQPAEEEPGPKKRGRKPGPPNAEKIARAAAWAEYVKACQVRKARIAELRATINAQRGIPVLHDAKIAAWLEWAKVQRQQCEDYIARHRPAGDGADVAAMESELHLLQSTIIPRPF